MSERGADIALAELAARVGLPAAVLQRWVAAGLLLPRRSGEDGFPFRALGTARTLRRFRDAGWTVPRLQRALQAARRVVPDPMAALDGLLASLGQRRVVVRAPDGGLVEPGGQRHFDFGIAPAPVPLRRPQDWFLAGVDAEAAGRLEEAVRAYQRALPDGGAEAHFNLGNCLYVLRRRDEAAAQFAAAVARDAEAAEAWHNLGVVRGELGDLPAAIAALQRALELVPHYADAHYNLAEALAAAGELDAARRHWRAYLSFDPHSRWAAAARRRLQTHGG